MGVFVVLVRACLHHALPHALQVDLGEGRIYAELVVRRVDDCVSTTIIATVTIPEAIGERRLVAGAGRYQLPCVRESASDGWTCADR